MGNSSGAGSPPANEITSSRSVTLSISLINRKTGLILASTVILAEPQLTKREKEILILIRQGFLSKEIAYKLNLSIYTVNNHRKNILAKLNVDNAIEAINKAENFGILY